MNDPRRIHRIVLGLLLLPVACQPSPAPLESPGTQDAANVGISRPRTPADATDLRGVDESLRTALLTGLPELEGYENWKRLSDNPYPVDPSFYFLCALPFGAMEEMERRGPHVEPAIRHFANDLAASALAKNEASLPVGAIIVKEKLSAPFSVSDLGREKDPENEPEPYFTLRGLGAMVKREAGYDPGGGDWEYVYAGEETGAERGRIENCKNCHAKAQATDYLFLSYLKDGDEE